MRPTQPQKGTDMTDATPLDLYATTGTSPPASAILDELAAS
jgi:hypothetical protein